MAQIEFEYNLMHESGWKTPLRVSPCLSLHPPRYKLIILTCDTQSREKVNILPGVTLSLLSEEGEDEATWGVIISMKNDIVMGPGLWVPAKTNPMPSGHT